MNIAGLVLLGPLSLAVRRPWPVARVAAWLSGFILSTGVVFVMASPADEHLFMGSSEPTDLRRALTNLLAGWYLPVSGGLVLAQVVLIIAFSVQLLRTTASDFYARPRQEHVGMWKFAMGQQANGRSGQTPDSPNQPPHSNESTDPKGVQTP